MLPETNAGYSTGYKSPENVLKQLHTEYNQKDSTLSGIVLLFFILIGSTLLNMETFDWMLFIRKILILGLFLLVVFIYSRFIIQKEKIPAFLPQHYKQIIQDLKRFYKPRQRHLLFFPLYIFVSLVLLFVTEDLNFSQFMNLKSWGDGKILGIIFLTVYFVYSMIQRYRRYKQLSALESEF